MNFSISPFPKKERQRSDSLSFQYEKAMLQAKRILLLDDDQDMRQLVGEVIEQKYRVEVVCCSRVKDAQTQLENDYFHAAILDVKVINGNGVSFYRHIVNLMPALKVVFLTGYDSPELRKEIESVGPAMVFSKDAMFKPDPGILP